MIHHMKLEKGEDARDEENKRRKERGETKNDVVGTFLSARVETFFSNLAFLMGNNEWEEDEDEDDFLYYNNNDDYQYSTNDYTSGGGGDMLSDDSWRMEQKIAAYSHSLEDPSCHTRPSSNHYDDFRHMSAMLDHEQEDGDTEEEEDEPRDSFVSLVL
ncbi:expressed unknown protein [Seminavis robusta]|uniref:Uncharacterized protein n=1 Tax=Seminavis robusta TaxID=568900 RepID=A0A9N8HIY2_9STRA|nr:expressed unknown protein [Seminavis robusta]|eukprot:Sro623_g177180.1 n/a (158) ;mRNA; f:42776-43249